MKVERFCVLKAVRILICKGQARGVHYLGTLLIMCEQAPIICRLLGKFL